MMSNAGIGQSTCIGVGGDMIPGSTFVGLLPLFEKDPKPGLSCHRRDRRRRGKKKVAAAMKAGVFTKPVIACIAGKNAPKGQVWTTPGAIVGADGSGSALGTKEKGPQRAGAHIADTTTHIVEILKTIKY